MQDAAELGGAVLASVVARLPLATLVERADGRLLCCSDTARALFAPVPLHPQAPVAELVRAWLAQLAPDLPVVHATSLRADFEGRFLLAGAAGPFQVERAALPGLGWLWSVRDPGSLPDRQAGSPAPGEESAARAELSWRALADAQEVANLAHLSKSRYFAAASHDLLQPLNAARIFASSLAEQPDLSAQGRQVAARIDAALRNAEEVIDVLVEVARLDTGAVRIAVETVDLGELLRGLVEQFAAIAQGRRLQLRLGPCRYLVASDRRLLRRLLQNLIANALRYTARGGVLVGVRRLAGGIRVEVVDTGPGLDPQQLARAFEEFQRAGPASPWGERGLGLGLAICQRICALLGHGIVARSRPGHGSAFGVEIAGAPRRRTAELVRELEGERSSPRLTLSVLCVDDDVDALDAMAALIGGWGARVSTASTREAAELALATGRYDVLLVDYQLCEDQRGDGLAIVARQRELQRPTAAILITADRSPEAQAAARALAVPVLHKPLRAMRLRALLESLARR